MSRLAGAVLLSTGLAAACASPAGGSANVTTPAPTRNAIAPIISARASMTVGELLAKGGRQLTAQELKNVFASATMEGASGTTTWRVKHSPDGNVTGQSFMRDGDPLSYRGTWWVDDQGRRCWVNARMVGSEPNCMYYYGLGGKYYASASDSSKRGASLANRDIIK